MKKMYLISTDYSYNFDDEYVAVNVDLQVYSKEDCYDIDNYLQYITKNFDSIRETDDYKKFLVRKKLSELSNK